MGLCFGFDLHNVDVCSTHQTPRCYMFVPLYGHYLGEEEVRSEAKGTFICDWRRLLLTWLLVVVCTWWWCNVSCTWCWGARHAWALALPYVLLRPPRLLRDEGGQAAGSRLLETCQGFVLTCKHCRLTFSRFRKNSA